MNILEEFEIYKELKTKDNILNGKLNFKSHYIFNIILKINNSIDEACIFKVLLFLFLIRLTIRMGLF